MEAGLQHQKAMLKIVEANKTDAAKAATELEAYLKANGDDIKAQKEALAKAKADPANNNITKMGEASIKTRGEVTELVMSLAKDAQAVMSDPKVAELLSAAE